MILRRFDNFLTEAHAQMELPFNGGKKPIHVDFIDAVEELAVKMQYKTSFDWDSIEQKALKTGVKRALDSIETEETSQEILIQWAELNQKIIDNYVQNVGHNNRIHRNFGH